MPRPPSDRTTLLRDAVADAWALSRDYRDAALSLRERACSNLLTQLGERYGRLAEDLHVAFAHMGGETPGMAPSPACQHLFAWHLAEDDGDPIAALCQQIRATENHLHGILGALLAHEPLPPVLRDLVEHGHNATGDANLRQRVARCLAPATHWSGEDVASRSNSTTTTAVPRPIAGQPTIGFTTVDMDDTITLAGLAEEGSPCDAAPPLDLDLERPVRAERDTAGRTCSVGLRHRVSPG
ncbi:MAG: hypothetical protein ACOCYE_05020 [Pseudomonadota bacterium]